MNKHINNYSVKYINLKSTSNYIKNLILIEKNNLYSVLFLDAIDNIFQNSTNFTFSTRCSIIKYNRIHKDIDEFELLDRYNFKRSKIMDKYLKDSNLCEKIKDENESYSDDSLYNITSFGTDLTFREIVAMYKEGDLEKPELQRKYVWTKNEASRFIDSILLGLPVPSIFLAKTNDNKRLIVDGYQRIMTIYDYMEGIFTGDKKVFKLSNSDNIHPNWRGKAFTELTEEQRRTIRTYPIHAIIFEQKQPQDDTGMYQIFERINTSGRALKPQEIRNCVYHGNYNNLLFDLNKSEVWRNIIGSNKEDARMADVELILRFFAFSEIEKFDEFKQNQINLVKFLNLYMKSKSKITYDELKECKNLFLETMNFLYNNIGNNVFRTGKMKDDEFNWSKKVNPVILDAVCTATIKARKTLKEDEIDTKFLYDKYEQLLQNQEFIEVTKQRTTNIENIKKRVIIAAKELYGVEICYQNIKE